MHMICVAPILPPFPPLIRALIPSPQLPHGTGKRVRVAVFATGDKAEEAREAGCHARRGQLHGCF